MVPLAVDVGSSLQRALDSFFEFIPNLIAFLVILVIGYFIAKAVKAAVAKALEKLGMDRALHESDAGQYVERVSPGARPSTLVGIVVFWIIFVFVLAAAIGALGIPAVTQFMNQVLAYLPNVVAAIVIFVIAAALAGAVAALLERTMEDSPIGRLLRAAAPALVIVIGVFMVLDQLKIAQEIVVITYAAILGAVALGMALAFGLGGRGVAADVLEDAYDKGRDRTRTRPTTARATQPPAAKPPPTAGI
jgi:small-conductance mechanosensitive channel